MGPLQGGRGVGRCGVPGETSLTVLNAEGQPVDGHSITLGSSSSDGRWNLVYPKATVLQGLPSLTSSMSVNFTVAGSPVSIVVRPSFVYFALHHLMGSPRC